MKMSYLIQNQLMNCDNNYNIIDFIECWSFRAEGNANIVLSCAKRKKVIRIRKSLVNQAQQSNDALSDLNYLKLCTSYMHFISKVFGKEYAIEPEIVQLNIKDLRNFNNNLLPHRQAKRLTKEIRTNFGILFPDSAQFRTDGDSGNPTIAVEIKPKQGWLPSPTECPFLFQILNKIIKTDKVKCRFCCMQYAKIAIGSENRLSLYCPLDLFSGQRNRMLSTINALFDNPQNNLKVFKNGQIVLNNNDQKKNRTEIESTLDCNLNEICQVIYQALLNKSQTEGDDLREEKEIFIRTDTCTGKSSTVLPENCVLDRILTVQNLAKDTLGQLNLSSDISNQQYSYVDNLLIRNPSDLNSLKPIEQYLLAATALDSSIMITFQKLNISNESNFKVNSEKKTLTTPLGNVYQIAINIMDLDPKPMTHYAKYIQQTESSVAAYNEFLKNNISSN